MSPFGDPVTARPHPAVRVPPVVVVRRTTANRLVAAGLMAVIIGSVSVLLIAEPDLGPYPILAALVGSFVAFALLVGLAPVRRTLSIGMVLVASGALLLGSAVAPTRSRGDLWAYAMYGRAVVEHRANPYVHPPADFPGDPLLEHVNPYWRG